MLKIFTPTIQLEHADSRGEIYSIALPDGHELMLLHSTPGAFRGGHSHSCDEIVVLLSGQMCYHKEFNRQDRPDMLRAGAYSFNPAKVNHMGEFLEDSWVIEYKFAKKGEWSQEIYEPFRSKVLDVSGVGTPIKS